MRLSTAIRTIAVAAIASIATTLSASAQDQTPVGTWLPDDKHFEVQISPCGAELCGTIVWLKSPVDSTGRPRTDTKNPDPSLRAQPLLGLTVLHVPNFGDAPKSWSGKIYNPDDGSNYDAKLSVADDGTLRVHAYMLAPFLGKTVVFTRAGQSTAASRST